MHRSDFEMQRNAEIGFFTELSIFGMVVQPNFNARKLDFRVAAINNCTIWRRILVRHPGTFAGAYRDMCRWM